MKLTEQLYRNDSIPYGFKDYVICGKNPRSNVGVCKGDSGGAVIEYDSQENRYFVMAIVHGNLVQCSAQIYPNIFVRTDSPSSSNFFKKVIRNEEVPLKVEPAVTSSLGRLHVQATVLYNYFESFKWPCH